MTDDREAVAELLGRPPGDGFEVVVRHADGSPLVIRNRPLLDDGTPMPTRYWLVGEPERTLVSRLEAAGGVDRGRGGRSIRSSSSTPTRGTPPSATRPCPLDHAGPRPSGGVGGTRTGVKCLHAHYAWFLAGGDDPVGRWVERRLRRCLGVTATTGGERGASRRPIASGAADACGDRLRDQLDPPADPSRDGETVRTSTGAW